jgi:hypothetical protein
MSEYHLNLPQAIRGKEILLVREGHKSRLSFLAAMFFLDSIELFVLPAHSSHLLQILNVSVVSSVKAAVKQEFDKRINRIAQADPEQREKAQIIRRVLVESFSDALRREARPGSIKPGLRATGFIPFNQPVPLDSAYAFDSINPGLFHVRVTGTKINEIVWISPEGLKFLCGHEHGTNISKDDDYRMELRQNIGPFAKPPSYGGTNTF